MKKALSVCAILCPIYGNGSSEKRTDLAIFEDLVEHYQKGQSENFTPVLINNGLLQKVAENNPAIYHKTLELVEKKRIFIAPLHALTELSIFNGETLIRNLLSAFSSELDPAFLEHVIILPTVYGLNSQLPQILVGFNIDAVILPELKVSTGPEQTIFIWEGPDGSALLTYRYFNPLKPRKASEPDLPHYLYLIYLYPQAKAVGDLLAEQLGSLPKTLKLQTTSPEDFIWEIKELTDRRELVHYKGEICGLINQDWVGSEPGLNARNDLVLQQSMRQLENELVWRVEPWSLVMNSLLPNRQTVLLPKVWEHLIELQAFTYWANDHSNWDDRIISGLTNVRHNLANQYSTNVAALLDNVQSFLPTRHHSYWIALNAYPLNRTEIVEAFLELPFQLNPSTVVMREVGGREVPIQILTKIDNSAEDSAKAKDGKALYHCLIELHNLAAMGWNTYEIQYQSTPKWLRSAPISAEKNALENDYLRVGILPNGTLEIFGKETGTFWNEQGFFMDGLYLGPNKGHGHCSPLTTRQLNPTINLLYNNPLGAAYRLEYHWELPTICDEQTGRRSRQLAVVKIVETLTLNRLANYLDVRLAIDAPVNDHQLAFCFPLDSAPKVCVTDGLFSIEKRPLVAHLQTRCTTMSMGNFIGFSNEDGGIAFFVQGLHEFNIVRGNPNIAALTLIKDFQGVSNGIAKRLYGGKRSYRIAIMPHLGNWDSSGIFNDIARFNTPIEIYPLTGNGNILPPRLQFLKIVPENLIFSCLKPSEHDEGVILRLFNPSGNQIEGEITTHLPIKSLRLLTLEEKIIERLELTDAQHFRIMVPPRKIVTIKIVFKESGD